MLRRQLAERARDGTLVFPSAVVEIRRSVGMNQTEFAGVLGMSRRQIADIERGAANPTLETINKIGGLFGFTVGFVPLERPFPSESASIAAQAPLAPSRDDRSS